MVAVGMKFWNVAWWMSFFPGLAIFITVLSVNLMGDALRDAFDSQLRM
jgi:peptide/nickel transport system permease protein